MYSWMIFLLAVLPTLLLFTLARFEPKGVGPSPMRIMGWTWLLGYTLKSIYLSYAVIYRLPFRPDWIAFYTIDTGQMAILLGVTTMIIGYMAVTVWLDQYANVTPLPNYGRVDMRVVYFPMLLISLVLMAIYFRQMGFVEQILSLRFIATKFFIDDYGQRNALGYLTIGGDFLVVFFVYYFAMARKVSWFSIYSLSMGFLAICLFLSSRRNGILAVVILLLIVMAVRNVKTSAFKRVVRLGLVCVVLVGVSFAGQIRNGASEGQAFSQLNVVSALQATATHAFQGAYFIDPAKTAAIIGTMEGRQDLLMGASFLGFIIAPIPRVLWPDKPSVRLGPLIAQDLFNFGSAAGVPPGAIGEFYMNFGWFGIAGGMALFGAGLAFLWWRHRNAEDPRFTIVRYAFFMVAAIYFVTVEFTAAIVIFSKYYVAILVAERYWRARLWREGRLTSGTTPPSSPTISSSAHGIQSA